MRELRATRAFPHGPDIGGARLEALIDANVPTIVQLNPCLLKSDSSGTGNTPGCHQDIATLYGSFAGTRAHNKTNLLSRPPTYLEEFGSRYDFNSLVAQNPHHLLRNVQILSTQNFGARTQ